jgi:predicted RNase H-like HicB family nuclease
MIQMKTYTTVIERCPKTNLLVGHVPGFPGAHSQGATLDELNRNLREAIELLHPNGESKFHMEFVDAQTVAAGA